MRILGLVASACGGLDQRLCEQIAEPAARAGWRLAVTLTPTAHRWLAHSGEFDRLQALTDLPVRVTSRLPSQPRPHPDPERFLFAPASANSVAKLAVGIADNQALTVLCEALGNGLPMVVATQVNGGHSGHPAWQGHLATLRAAGVGVHALQSDLPWTTVVDALGDA